MTMDKKIKPIRMAIKNKLDCDINFDLLKEIKRKVDMTDYYFDLKEIEVVVLTLIDMGHCLEEETTNDE